MFAFCTRLLCITVLWLAAREAAAADGARVVTVDPQLSGAVARLHPGDRLLAAGLAGGESMPIQDPFDALTAEVRWSRLGAVEVRIATATGGQAVRRIPPDAWGLDYAIDGSHDDLDHLAAANNIIGFCDRSIAVAAGLPARSGAWLHWRCARLAAAAGEWARARTAFDTTLQALADDADARLAVIIAQARSANLAKQWAQFDHAMSHREPGTGSACLRVQSEFHVAGALAFQSRYAESVARFESAFAAMPEALRDTPVEAYALNEEGYAFRHLERFEEADRVYTKAIAIHDRIAPGSLGAAAAHMNLGMLRRIQGRPVEAHAQIEGAVAAIRKIAPGSARLSGALNNLSLLYWDEGDFVTADAVQSEALAISERLAPEGYDVAVSLQNLGAMALDRGDVALAQVRQQRALAIFERVAPDSNSVALGYHNLAGVYEQNRDFATAAAYYRRAIALWQRISPGTLREAWSHHNLANNAREEGRLDEAAAHFQAAQAIRSKVAPGGLDEARGNASLGALELQRGDMLSARGHLDLARETMARIAPESQHLAVVLHSLGELERDENHAPQARAMFCEADRVLDLQRTRISVSRELQSEFSAQYERIPRDCALWQLEAGDAGAAFDTIERSRARALRERLGDFRVAFAALPPSLRDAHAEIAARRSRLEAGLAGAEQNGDAGASENATRELIALESDERAWLARLAKQAPRVARELAPRVEDHRVLLAQLPADAAVVVYMAGETSSRAWLLSGADRRIEVATIPLGARALTNMSADLRRGLVERRPEAALRAELRAAYQALLGPFAGQLAKTPRLLIVPDRGMTLIPFAALVDRDTRYLVESYDLALAPSVSVALENLARPATSQVSLVAVALTGARQLEVDTAQVDFPPIPAAASEVSAIADDYGTHSQLFIDANATEARVRLAAERSSVLHIASHAFFDPQRPLDSGLLFARDGVGESGDGVLHAWEVMASWNMPNSPLVVLSACDTGIGEERAGEGLIGLSRAFQYAGAGSVVASLWPVADRSTAWLMRDFHRALLAGERPAAALQAAQRALLRRASIDVSMLRGVGTVQPRGTAMSASHPFYWAGFEVFGQLP